MGRISLGLLGPTLALLNRIGGLTHAEIAQPHHSEGGAVNAVEDARAGGAELVLLVAGDGPLAAEVRSREGAGVRALGHRDDLDELDVLILLEDRRE